MRVAEATLQRCSYEKEGVLKICSKFTGELPCQSVISIKLQSSFFEITLRHECSPVNLLHIFRTPFPKSTSGGMLLDLEQKYSGAVGQICFSEVLFVKHKKMSMTELILEKIAGLKS